MNILAFFAHPDDESMLIGGTLALLVEQGAHIHYVCATRGEGGEVGEPPVTTPDKLGEVREQELACAVKALGGSHSLTFLDYEDPRIGPDDELFAFTDDPMILAGEVATSIRQIGADVVISHGSNGEYGHPAHVLCFKAALTAVLAAPPENAPTLYTVAANYPEHPKPRLANKDDPADLVIDISTVVEKKVRAALCHKSQNALFVRRASEDAGRLVAVEDVVMLKESLHRAHPKVQPGEELEDELFELLKRAGALIKK